MYVFDLNHISPEKVKQDGKLVFFSHAGRRFKNRPKLFINVIVKLLQLE